VTSAVRSLRDRAPDSAAIWTCAWSKLSESDRSTSPGICALAAIVWRFAVTRSTVCADEVIAPPLPMKFAAICVPSRR
jgi:hypothetical protein